MPQIIASSERSQQLQAQLSESEREAIDKEFHCYPTRQSVCIEALKIVQLHRGWVSDEAVDAIAAYLLMSPAQVDGVATFYNLIFRQPVGKKVIFLCNSVSCWLMGYEKLKSQLEKKLNIKFGQTSKDGDFTLLPITCLGDCDHAPALMLNKQHYGSVDSVKLEKIVDGELTQ
ncbi:MAG: NADH-quinone oxidoreductase subunit NuoE [Spongiibacteraceae bacterium]|nr:NADH-quinone oxidoreductase subunit NuoE [Spongiibacteraceae bacterium]